MSALTILVFVVGVAVTMVFYAFGVRRLLGLRISARRAALAGAVAVACGSPIITAVASSVPRHPTHVLPAVWFILLGVALALLAGMLVVVVAEALVPTGSLPGVVFIIRGSRARVQRLHRYVEITRILARHGMLPYLRGARRAELASGEGRRALARSVARALEEGGVTFVKLGQVLATRRDLVAPEFIAELGRLQDDAASIEWADVEDVLTAELGQAPEDVFATIDRTPLAAASIAQVHPATLHDGDVVVVKVRRPGIETVVEGDLDIVARLAARLEQSTRWGRGVGAVALAHGFGDALREELDLRVEARNMASVAAAQDARGGDRIVHVPRRRGELCTANVLVMEQLEGRPLSAIGPDEAIGDRAALARALFDELLAEVMLDGVFHADPHPGNVFLLSDGRVGLLDFGSVGRLDAELRGALQRLLLAVDRGSPVALCDALLELAQRPDGLDEAALERSLGRFLARHVAAGMTPDVRMFTDLFRIIADNRLAIPAEIAGAFRSLATIEGTLTQFADGFDLIDEARRFATDEAGHRLRPSALRQVAEDDLLTLVPMLRRLPRRLDRISASLEAGRLTVSARLLADPSDRRYITGLVHQVLVTALAATSGLMAVLMLGLHGGPQVTHTVSLYAFFGYCLLVVSGVLALRVLIVVFRLQARE